ncbi:TPA: DUF3387 domain-containing protein [Morganella morganii subsp. morganii]|nr:DUF3387 domain-containing protein [Morganella morganii subsp. morganii]
MNIHKRLDGQTLRKYKYPPNKTPHAVELILNQAEVISPHWAT